MFAEAFLLNAVVGMIFQLEERKLFCGFLRPQQLLYHLESDSEIVGLLIPVGTEENETAYL